MLFKRIYYELRIQADITYFFCFCLLLLISIFTHLGTMDEATGFIENYIALAAIILYSNVFFYRQRHNIVEIEAQYKYSVYGRVYRSMFAILILFILIIIFTYFIFAVQTNSRGISLKLYAFNMYSIIVFFGAFTIFMFSVTKSISIALTSSIILWVLNSSLNSLIPHEYKIFNAYLGENWLKVKLIYLLGGITLFIINQLIYNKRFRYEFK
ncbi:hypothetical protein J7E73_20610 [Paenibacillus albidus]|uniref:hypothetical protein n=1 Tax=Paenibacillus albidus TaxID=2041023 RepID=UPI001BE8E746|nr:hypothetical protein [Paenibacillus albidus]MBT2291480.1 hypothetical protein [Paenibacillus albidus]